MRCSEVGTLSSQISEVNFKSLKEDYLEMGALFRYGQARHARRMFVGNSF